MEAKKSRMTLVAERLAKRPVKPDGKKPFIPGDDPSSRLVSQERKIRKTRAYRLNGGAV